MAWGFTHEFQHAFDARGGHLRTADLISGHPDSVYGDMPYFGPIIDAGEHYDWEAQTLRLFTGFDTLAGPYNDYLEVDDPDGDRLASNDARVPMDEQRFLSNANAGRHRRRRPQRPRRIRGRPVRVVEPDAGGHRRRRPARQRRSHAAAARSRRA